MNVFSRLTVAATLGSLIAVTAPEASAATIQVSELAAAPGVGVWGTNLADGGTASLVDLTGLGGSLESNQPLPTGAVRLTTGPANSDRAEVAIGLDLGPASGFLTGLDVGYSYYKEAVGATAPAPAFKLAIFSPTTTGTGIDDGFGQLIYEPTWNQPGAGSQPPPTGDWQTVDIASTTGDGATSTGGWWWTGGFGQPNGGGGPPIRSAAEWDALFTGADGYSDARIIGIALGVGTFNQNQVGYVDAVRIGETTYNFETEPIPEPTSLVLALFGGCGGLAMLRRRRKTA